MEETERDLKIWESDLREWRNNPRRILDEPEGPSLVINVAGHKNFKHGQPAVFVIPFKYVDAFKKFVQLRYSYVEVTSMKSPLFTNTSGGQLTFPGISNVFREGWKMAYPLTPNIKELNPRVIRYTAVSAVHGNPYALPLAKSLAKVMAHSEDVARKVYDKSNVGAISSNLNRELHSIFVRNQERPPLSLEEMKEAEAVLQNLEQSVLKERDTMQLAPDLLVSRDSLTLAGDPDSDLSDLGDLSDLSE